MSGAVEAQGCSLEFDSTLIVPITIYAVGGNGNTTLISNPTPFGTVVAQGNNTDGNATLIVAGGCTNYGTIGLQSASGSASTSNVVVSPGSTFNDYGPIVCYPSINPSTLTGNIYLTVIGVELPSGLVYYIGSIQTPRSGATLIVNANSPNLTVTDTGSPLAPPPSSFIIASTGPGQPGIIAFDGGTLVIAGGGTSGAVEAQGCLFALYTRRAPSMRSAAMAPAL